MTSCKIPNEDYQRLLEDAEMLQDVRAYDEARESLATGEKGSCPAK